MTRLAGRDGRALVAVLTIVDEEYDAVRAAGNFADFVPQSAYLYRSRVADDEYDVILAKSPDRSNGPCMTLVAELTERFRPEFIVLSGIAGGVEGRDNVALGDVVVADHVENYEIRKFQDGRGMTRRVALDHPSVLLRETIAHRVKVLNKWQEQVKVDRPESGSPKVIVGNLIAGEKILGDGENEYQKKILEEFDKAIAVDMESFGLARGAFSARATRHYNLNYLVVRGISDLVNQEGNDDVRKQWRTYAAATAAAFSMAAVDELIRHCG